MSRSPFDPMFAELPKALPIFPLAGALLLPGGRLPLNVFEPRYLAMTRDALLGDRLIGMVQPRPGEESGPAEKAPPAIYPLGCVGRIVSFNETEDGRYHIVLMGLLRFNVASEIETFNGYRRVVADFAPYAHDLAPAADGAIERKELFETLRVYFKRHGVDADWKSLESAGDERLVTTLAMACPFAPSEQQALLAAPDLAARGRVVLSLLAMAMATPGGDGGEARH
jgi:Lon protease-like protein